MTEVAYISPGQCLLHDTGFGHPERIERLQSINNRLNDSGLIQDLILHEARAASQQEIAAIHPQTYIDMVTASINSGASSLDGDTSVSAQSMDAAYLAAGAALTGLDLIYTGDFKRVFCGVRPPGHHAEVQTAMGFCIFNNVAVAAAYARQKKWADRILILDWDVHHGNGTQHIFESSDKVFYYSLHQFPFYPGTGAASEIGRGDGTGFTLNRPMSTGADDLIYLKALEKDLHHIGEKFKPELVIISAGFDAHQDDPLGGVNVTTKGYVEMTQMVQSFADTWCEGRLLSVLEGGYNLNALADCVEQHLITMKN